MDNYIDVVKGATIYPAINDFKGYGRFIHGVSTSSGNDPIEYGLSRNGEPMTKYHLREEYEVSESHNKKYLKGTFLYGGPLSQHFGHMLAECTNRLWACSEYQDDCDGIIFLPDQNDYKLKKLHKELFDLFDVDINKAIFLESMVEVETLLIPNIGASLGAMAKNWYKKKLLQIMGTEKFFDANKPKKIVVSRKNFTHVGRVAGSDALIITLKENDYFEFCPEKYSLYEQFSYLLSAENIIWEEGSALHLLEIIPEIVARSFLIRRRPDYDEFDGLLTSKSTDKPIVYNNISYLDLDVVPHNRMSRFNNVEELIRLLHEKGFISVLPENMNNFLSSEFFDIQTSYHREIKSILLKK